VSRSGGDSVGGLTSSTGSGGKKRGPETRVDVYLTGSDEPYRLTYAKLSKKDEEALRRHSESLRQSPAAYRG
jgi:hypothetical protein